MIMQSLSAINFVKETKAKKVPFSEAGEREREREYLFSRSFSAKRQRERDEAERDEAFDDDLIFCHFS